MLADVEVLFFLINPVWQLVMEPFPQGDDAFDAAVGLFGMLQVCNGQRAPGEPDEAVIREIEGRILRRNPPWPCIGL